MVYGKAFHGSVGPPTQASGFNPGMLDWTKCFDPYPADHPRSTVKVIFNISEIGLKLDNTSWNWTDYP
ncbi:Hypothetical protein D9617_35g089730 [Elsinoe fawcettii]|nr:Hypothetical protein D9617_35g089730 [Elsinoe fawcettii]